MSLICKIKSPVIWVNKMKNKEKIIIYIWLCSLVIIVLIGVMMCFQRPSEQSVAANKEMLETAEKIRAFYRNRPDYWGLNGNEAVKNQLFTAKINNNQLLNSLNKKIIIGADSEGTTVMPGQKSFAITYLDVDKKECIELASFSWKAEENLGLLSMMIQNDGQNYEFSWGDKGLPLSQGRAKQFCHEKNNIMWLFE